MKGPLKDEDTGIAAAIGHTQTAWDRLLGRAGRVHAERKSVARELKGENEERKEGFEEKACANDRGAWACISLKNKEEKDI